MLKLAVLVFSSVLLIGALPSHAEGPGDVLQGIGRAMNGEPPPPPPDYYWREHQRERAYWHEQHRRMPSNANLTRAAGLCTTSAASTRKTAFTGVDNYSHFCLRT
jgi:hypothetical protein